MRGVFINLRTINQPYDPKNGLQMTHNFVTFPISTWTIWPPVNVYLFSTPSQIGLNLGNYDVYLMLLAWIKSKTQKMRRTLMLSQPKVGLEWLGTNWNVFFVALLLYELGSMTSHYHSPHRWIFCQKNLFFFPAGEKLWKISPYFSLSKEENCQNLHFFGYNLQNFSNLYL